MFIRTEEEARILDLTDSKIKWIYLQRPASLGVWSKQTRLGGVEGEGGGVT